MADEAGDERSRLLTLLEAQREEKRLLPTFRNPTA